ncbi:MAG: peptide ABC transporter substrate-binding protein [Anaerolineaceae bacterium]|nr:peptide ABC transporter substrate-binding protein [Anaerolineaceae bacterium]
MKKIRLQLIIILTTAIIVGILLIVQKPISGTLLTIPSSGGVYTEALVGEFGRLNPVLDMHNQADQDIDQLIFSGLVKYDASGLPVPDLAESWGISTDGTVYNFALRNGLLWHDGDPVTVDDIIFTVELFRDSSLLIPDDVRAFWSEVALEKIDDTTVQFRLPEAYAPFLDHLGFGILPAHLLDGRTVDQLVNDPFNLQPVGTGPYRFERLIIDKSQVAGVVLKVNENYYGDMPFLQQVIFLYYPDSASAFEAYSSGEVKGISEVDSNVLPKVLLESDLASHTAMLNRLSLIYLNLKNNDVPFLADENVRKALILSLNRTYMIHKFIGGQAVVADGPIMPGGWAYYPGAEVYEFDQERARQILAAAEYNMPAEGGALKSKDGIALEFTLLYPNDDLHKALAEQIQKDWAGISVIVDIIPLGYDQLINDYLVTRSYQAALVELNMIGVHDPDPYPFWDSAMATGGQNYSQWDSKVASEYLELARTIPDVGERIKLYRNFQVLFSKQVPAIPLYYNVYTFSIDHQVQDVTLGPLFNISDRLSTLLRWNLANQRSARDGASEGN